MRDQIRIESFESTTIADLAAQLRLFQRNLEKEFTLERVTPSLTYDTEQEVFCAIVVWEITP